MIHQECKKCQFYNRIKHTLDQLDQRVKFIKPSPGDIPKIMGIDIYGETLPKEGVLGGDHIIYIDFNKRYNLDARIDKIEENCEEDIKEFTREEIAKNPYIQKKMGKKNEINRELKKNRHKAGVLVADVRGHDESGSFLVGMLHQSFLTGALYEMKIYGNITTNLFEKLNTRFYNSSSVDDFFTMIYGEISEEGKFKFVSAGHPAPLIFSAQKNKFIDIPPELIVNYPPIGVMPSKKDIDSSLNQNALGYKQEYKISELNLMEEGDIMLLYTDGLAELENEKGESFFPSIIETILKKKKKLSAEEICFTIRADILDFEKEPQDDITYVIIKKTS
ncbi:MAG: serine/threonine-protein phosphatase [Candidatus Aminicenantes bacterium]|nr:serine/threonine-protein phosphatase [Candidatus Aminicenantes bacterium]